MNNQADLQKITDLLASDLSAYKIEKDTGVSRTTLSQLRTGKADIRNISFDVAIKLTDYFNKLTD